MMASQMPPLPAPLLRWRRGQRGMVPETGSGLVRSVDSSEALDIVPLMRRFLSLLAWMSIAWTLTAAENPTVVEIWPGAVPDESGDIGPEKIHFPHKIDPKQVEVTEPTRLITGVSKPAITIFRPLKENPRRNSSAHLPGRRLLGSLLADRKARKSRHG